MRRRLLATNLALGYINYPVRIMFKSVKLLPVMVVGIVMQKKRYTLEQWAMVRPCAELRAESHAPTPSRRPCP